ncbi:polyphosphate kinase 2 family protein [Leifsonia bigeumensis]|uniref:Polyphosphate kinase 2 family protein n=1 Tax=Leifsonella bigeumensis TaxID=433643 RepID=A0ABP7FF75_9MICO
MPRSAWTDDPATLLKVMSGFVLADVDPSSTPGFEGDKDDGEALLTDAGPEIADLQERLYAESREGGLRKVLLVLQAMDTAGKGGVIRHVVGAIDPQGVKVHGFKKPTPEELEHDFLWRIRKQLPPAGVVGVFDRSHYEDVLIARVRGLAPAEELERRYDAIVAFENELVADDTTVIKVMLHLSAAEQKERLAERLDRADKHWKYNPGDLDERALWPEYQRAYQLALERTATEAAPWYVVPADRKWYARIAVQRLLLDALRRLDPQWPAADFDVEAEKKRLAQS